MLLSISYEESPASNYGIGVWVIVTGNKMEFPDILHIDEFFQSLQNLDHHIAPIFTCTCGSFGCGGYYLDSKPQGKAWVWGNHFDPLTQQLIRESQHSILWEDARQVARELVEVLERVQHEYPGAEIFSGTYGLDLAPRIEFYRELVEQGIPGRAIEYS